MIAEEGPCAIQEVRTSQLNEEERYESYDAGRNFALKVIQLIAPGIDLGNFESVADRVIAKEREAAACEVTMVTEATEAAGVPKSGPEVESHALPTIEDMPEQATEN